jgi:hypothetical protein
MYDIDEKMATCPLKQEIRQNLWEIYIRKLKKSSISYLTLFSPPLMDVKHFANKGIVVFQDGIYKNVVAITRTWKEGYNKIIKESRGRPELIKVGLINDFLSQKDKELIDKFPFDVINLDYCNSIFGTENKPYLSENLKDLQQIIGYQNKKDCQKFILFITTRTDKNNPGGIGFAANFLSDLSRRIKVNIDYHKNFNDKYKTLFNYVMPHDLVNQDFENFISLGLVKLIGMELASHTYTIQSSDIHWLKRDTGKYQRDLLHIALLIEKGKPINYKPRKKIQDIGTTIQLDAGVVTVLDRMINGEIKTINERNDLQRLQQKNGKHITSLREDTFEIPIPRPLE